jgi:carbamate kinase
MTRRLAVVAIGGNSLIRDKDHQGSSDQHRAARETCAHIAGMIRTGWDVVITHGNGPQVGFMLRRGELARSEVFEEPLEVCGADTQGAIGYMLQQGLYNEFRSHGLHKQAVTVVTQVVVDPRDPAYNRPTKPIGSFMTGEEAFRRRDSEGWSVAEDAGRGWRRVVPSPMPLEIVELEAIRSLIASGHVVIAVGGGGIPVIRNPDGELLGSAAVIDKDHASSLLARQIGADLLLISTGIEQVYLDFGTPRQRAVDVMTVEDAEAYVQQGHFAKGSMLPKIEAILQYLKAGGKEALITSPENIERALAGETGTWVVKNAPACKPATRASRHEAVRVG